MKGNLEKKKNSEDFETLRLLWCSFIVCTVVFNIANFLYYGYRRVIINATLYPVGSVHGLELYFKGILCFSWLE